MIDVWDELETDLCMFATPDQVKKILVWLDENNLIDCDVLEDFYTDISTDDE